MRVDSRGNHIGGQGLWGHCAPNCPNDQSNKFAFQWLSVIYKSLFCVSGGSPIRTTTSNGGSLRRKCSVKKLGKTVDHVKCIVAHRLRHQKLQDKNCWWKAIKKECLAMAGSLVATFNFRLRSILWCYFDFQPARVDSCSLHRSVSS